MRHCFFRSSKRYVGMVDRAVKISSYITVIDGAIEVDDYIEAVDGVITVGLGGA